jgi:hypothetical protein
MMRKDEPLIEAREASFNGAASADAITDTRSNNDAGAGKHLPEPTVEEV